MHDLAFIYSDLKNKKVIKNLTDFALKIDYGYIYMSEIRAGKKPITSSIVEKINKTFGTSYEFQDNNPRQSNVTQSYDDYIYVPLITINAQAGYLNSLLDNDLDYMNDL